VRAADDELPGRIDVVLDVAADQLRRQFGDDDLVDDVVVNLLLRHVGRVLRADDHRVDPHGAVAVVFHRHLALAVGPQPLHFAVLPGLGQPVQDAMRKGDRQRHQLGRFVARIAEHQPLVAGAVAIDAHRDIGALAVQLDQHFAGVGAEADVVMRIADLADDFAGDFFVIDLGLGSPARQQKSVVTSVSQATRLIGS
jgi:hypothetical protein